MSNGLVRHLWHQPEDRCTCARGLITPCLRRSPLLILSDTGASQSIHALLSFTSTFTFKHLTTLPRDPDHVFQSLFTSPVPFSVSVPNHEQFWPLIDNIYSIRAANDVSLRKRDGCPAHVRHNMICRLKRSRAVPSTSQWKRAFPH
jgi:hypothetical protein